VAESATDLPDSKWCITATSCDSGRENSIWPQSSGCLLRRRGVSDGCIEKGTKKVAHKGGRGGYYVNNQLAVCSLVAVQLRQHWLLPHSMAVIEQSGNNRLNTVFKRRRRNNQPACSAVQRQRKATINRLSVAAKWQWFWKQLLPCSNTAIATKW